MNRSLPDPTSATSLAGRLAGGLIDRATPVSFRFDGRPCGALRATPSPRPCSPTASGSSGARSSTTDRAGIFTAGPEEPNALVELRTGARREPNTKATTVELYDGLEATSQNRWPSLAFDLLAVNQLFAPLLVGGFYYKTFMWPASLWEKLYEPMIRRAAGLGRASGLPDPDRYEKAIAHCDLLVVGSGPSGLMAALAAGRSGARVILCEDDFRLGGRLLSETYEIDGLPGREWVRRAEAELAFPPGGPHLPAHAGLRRL